MSRQVAAAALAVVLAVLVYYCVYISDSEPDPTTLPSQASQDQEEAAAPTKPKQTPKPPAGTVVNVYSHDPTAFTQGLFVHNNKLFESTGLYGQSVLRQVDLQSGQVIQQTPLSKELFGEGCAIWEDQIIMLTWRERVMHFYNPDNLQLMDHQPFATTRMEGWGITHDGKRLIVSDGSSYLHFWSPVALPRQEQLFKLQVKLPDGTPVEKLNELEYINGLVYANVWYEDVIVKIDPATGVVVDTIHLNGLIDPYKQGHRVDCLNGIAWNSSDPDHILVTGKMWPKLFRVAI